MCEKVKYAIRIPDDTVLTVDDEVREGKRLAWDENGYYLDDEFVAECAEDKMVMSTKDAGALTIHVGSHEIRFSKDPLPAPGDMTFEKLIALLEAEGAR